MSIVSDFKEVAELIKKIGNTELYRKIVELEGDVIELTREKRALEEQNEELKRSLKMSKQMTFREPFCFVEGDAHPFCPKCWEVDMVAVHMLGGSRDTGTGLVHYHCPNCKTASWAPKIG